MITNNNGCYCLMLSRLQTGDTVLCGSLGQQLVNIFKLGEVNYFFLQKRLIRYRETTETFKRV